MANGDEAVTEGMDKVLGTADRRLGYDEINKTRDYIAQKFKAIRDAIRSIATGGTGASTAAGARTNLAVPETAVAGLKFTSPGFGRISYQAPGVAYETELATAEQVAGKASSSTVTAALAGKADSNTKDGYLNPSVYARTLGGSYRVCYINSDGTLGWVSSSRRHKKDIHPADVDVQAVLSLELVSFLYKVEIDTDRRAELQHGLIAEQLDEAGLDWLVDYGADGLPEGVRYDRLALALLPVVQDLAARISAIETHLDAIGGDLDASATE